MLYLDEIRSPFFTANVIFLFLCLECQQLFCDTKVALQDRLLHTGLSCPFNLILVNVNIYFENENY